MKTKDLIYIAIFAALISICSWISIPTTVPFSMQTFGVFLALLLLGGKRGTIAVIVYILLGAVGAPVFSGFRGGINHLVGATGGYITGFILIALIMWAFEKTFGRKKWSQAASMLLGTALCYAAGTFWFMSVYAKTGEPIGYMTALGWCVIPFIIPDIVKMGLAFVLSDRLYRFIDRD